MKNKIIILGLVGCLTLGSVSFAVGEKDVDENVVDNMSNSISVNKDNIKVETETIKTNVDNAEIDIKIPTVKGLKDLVYQEQLNYLIKETAEKDLKEFEEQVKELSKSDIEWKPELKISYEVKSEKDILSFVVDFYSYTGGANGISRKDYYNIDVDGNKNIRLADSFKENSDYKTIINDEINKQIKEQVATGEKAYFEGEEGFKTIKDQQSFYVDKDGNIVITFQMYEIAPRYMGHPEFRIPKTRIADILKDEILQLMETKEIINFDKVIINDKEVELKNKMFKSDKGTVMIPLAEVSKALGFQVKWDGENRVVNINKGPVSAGAYVDKGNYYFSKALVYLEEEAHLINGTAFVPVSFIDKVIQGEANVSGDGVLNIKY